MFWHSLRILMQMRQPEETFWTLKLQLFLTLLDNLLIHDQPNTEALWAYLWTLMGMPGLAPIFADYQRTIMFQISDDQDSTFQIAKLDFFYTRLYGNDCDVLFALRTMILLFAISYSQNSNFISILSSHISFSNLIWDVICSAIHAEPSRQTNTTNATHYSGIPCGNKPSQWKKNFQQQQQL